MNIYDAVNWFVPLKKHGANWIGFCPFRSENTPSFAVNPKHQIYHCFGCGIGGTAEHFTHTYLQVNKKSDF